MSRKRYSNPWTHERHDIWDILKWKWGLGPQEVAVIPEAPDVPAGCRPVVRAQIANPPATGWRVVWLGHASFLVQGFGASILIDPIFSDYCSPIPISSLRRKASYSCGWEELPEIDVVLLTHSHYDHLDLKGLLKMPGKTQIVIAEGHSKWLAKKLSRPVAELAWYGEMRLNDRITLTSTPAQHFTARTPFDRNVGHWCGWLLESGGSKIWHAGDSGYCPAFREIGERFGPIDFAMVPIGAYQPRSIMKPMHMNPEEAVMAFVDARCKKAVGMHWGTFSLTDEPMGEPPIRLAEELKRLSISPDVFVTGEIGEMWRV
jgi:N-acyl-phosphatidylethanolamine-hydrolysing phospholipase D